MTTGAGGETGVDGQIAAACQRALDLLGQGASQREVLTCLVTAAEAVSPGSVASILVLDKQGLLRNGASPNLPPDYLDAIDRLQPDPAVGTCASAAATGSVVMTPDFRADEKWAELRHWPLSLGFQGAWSLPIKSPQNTVLGTFGTYFRVRRRPTPEEHRSVERLAAVAALALSRAD
jgi:GAF domain-containing protein